jgi:hypothetical protein
MRSVSALRRAFAQRSRLFRILLLHERKPFMLHGNPAGIEMKIDTEDKDLAVSTTFFTGARISDSAASAEIWRSIPPRCPRSGTTL